jgi:hypothetical protein
MRLWLDPTNKKKTVQPSRPTLMRLDITRLDKALRKLVQMNKPNNLYVKPMISKCFKYGEPWNHSRDCRRHKLANLIKGQYKPQSFNNEGELCKLREGNTKNLNKYNDDERQPMWLRRCY